jgi:hypothetical protein
MRYLYSFILFFILVSGWSQSDSLIRYSIQSDLLNGFSQDTPFYYIDVVLTIENKSNDTIYIPYSKTQYAFLNIDSSVLSIDPLLNKNSNLSTQIFPSSEAIGFFHNSYGNYKSEYPYHNYDYGLFEILPMQKKKVKYVDHIVFDSKKTRNKNFKINDFLICGEQILILRDRASISAFDSAFLYNKLVGPCYLTIAYKVTKSDIELYYSGFHYDLLKTESYSGKRKKKAMQFQKRKIQ